MSLRFIEEATGTFCFIEGNRDDPLRDPKPLLVCGSPDARRQAEEMLRKRIDLKLLEGWVNDDGSSPSLNSGNLSGTRSNEGKGGKKAHIATSKGASGYDYPVDRTFNHPASMRLQAAPQETGMGVAHHAEDGAWGNWGGGSSDEDVAKRRFADARANSQSMNVEGRWTTTVPAYAGNLSSHHGSATLGYSTTKGAEDLPPHLMQEEAWPELGQLGQKRR